MRNLCFTERSLQFSKFAHKSLGSSIFLPSLFFLSVLSSTGGRSLSLSHALSSPLPGSAQRCAGDGGAAGAEPAARGAQARATVRCGCCGQSRTGAAQLGRGKRWRGSSGPAGAGAGRWSRCSGLAAAASGAVQEHGRAGGQARARGWLRRGRARGRHAGGVSGRGAARASSAGALGQARVPERAGSVRSTAQVLERAGSAGAVACRLGEPGAQLSAVCGARGQRRPGPPFPEQAAVEQSSAQERRGKAGAHVSGSGVEE
jgi:hypothetical protein